MKGKVSVYYDMPNVAKFRARVANPSKELTSQIRSILTTVVAETINENILGIRAKFIAAVDALGIEYTSETNKQNVQNIFNSIFDVVASAEKPSKVDESEPGAGEADWE